jgi:hypothetical protein
MKNRNHPELALARAENQREMPTQAFTGLRNERLEYGRISGTSQQQGLEFSRDRALLLQVFYIGKNYWRVPKPANGTARNFSGTKQRI